MPRYSDRSKGWTAGAPLRFLKGHNRIKRGAAHPRWKGGRREQNGYIQVWTPRGDQYEHIVVAERALGRKLKPGQVVHHIDGNRKNNANLLICSDAYHKALHIRLEQSPAWPQFRPRPRFRGYTHV